MTESLSAADYESLDAALATLMGGSLNERLDCWASLVEMIERGEYSESIYEYYNDLAVRSSLSQIQAKVTQRLRDSIAERLQPLDERFLAATFQPASAMPGVGDDWLARVPLRASGELSDDIASMRPLT